MSESTIQRSVLGGLLAIAVVGVVTLVSERAFDGGAVSVEAPAAQAPTLDASASVIADFVDTPLTELTMFMSEVTGRDFIYDGSLEGEVTITSHRPTTPEQLYGLFVTGLEAHGFGIVEEGDAARIVPIASAARGRAGLWSSPETATELDLTLVATVIAGDEAAAIIASGDYLDTARQFRAGDSLGGSAIVTLVRRNYVLLMNDGEVEYLYAGRDSQSSSGDASPVVGSTAEERAERALEREERLIARRAARESTPAVTQVVVSPALAAQLIDVEGLAAQIRIIPHKDSGGDIDGYRLSAVRRDSLFDKLGIKNGDIINVVNGLPVTSLEAAVNAYKSIQNEARFEVELTRRAQKQILEFEIR